jgi:two-component sensor histidine kinase
MWREWYSRWQARSSRGAADAYVAAAILIAVASLVRGGLSFLGDTLLPFTTFYPAVLLATYLGGVRVGGFAMIVGAVVGWWVFLPPHLTTSRAEIELLLYLCTCALIIWCADIYRRLASRLKNEEKLRKIAVEELAHRLKNKIASIQSIISYQLRDQPRLREEIVARLIALSGTDDLIMASQGQGASIRAILSTELRPYGLSRISMEGPNILLTPTFALTMALMVHELATNAAKYGALSHTVGRISIWWSLTDRTMNLEWRESGGPLVIPPAKRGFGLELLSRGLEQFNGAVETIFEKNGVICRMKAVLPESMPSLVPDEEPNGAAAA